MNLARFNRILLSVMILPILALLGMAITLYWQMQEANTTVTMIERADQRINEALQLDQYVLDEETSVRGYEITRDPEVLKSVTAARRQVTTYLDALDAQEGTPERTRLLKDIRTAYERWDHGFVTPLLEKLRSGTHVEDTQRHAESEQQLRLVHADITALKQIPQKRRVERVALWQEQTRRLKIILATLAGAIGLALGFFMRYSLHQVSDAYKDSLQVLRVRADEIYRSEQNLRTTLASIGDGVITCDPDGRVLTMNAVAQELTGWTEAEATKQQLEQVFDIVNESTRQRVENPVSKVKRLNRVVGLANHTILRRRDGTEIHIDDSGAPIRDQQGKLIGVVMVFRDITLQRRSQEALIANEKLAVAGRLAASIAHEIHNPLDSVANLLYLMSGPSTPEETTLFLEMAKQELARVTQISRAMLSLYREPKQPVAIDVAEMLNSVLMLMDRRFQELGVSVESDLPQGLVVHGFPAELRQVFTNLLSNAAEAANLGGDERGCIEVKAFAASSTNDRSSGVTVTIRDNGPGIPETIRERLFQPFFTTKAENGTGLGLWVSRGIVNRHSGEISLNSDTSIGGHFTEARVFLMADPVIQPETAIS